MFLNVCTGIQGAAKGKDLFNAC